MNSILGRSLAHLIQRKKQWFMYWVLAISVCQAYTVHCKNFVQACGQCDTPVTTAWPTRSTRPSSALMLAIIMYFTYHHFSENIALNSENFNLHLLEACRNINRQTMLLFTWLQIVIWMQLVNTNCIAFFFHDTPCFEPMFCPLTIVVYISNLGRIFHIPSWSKYVTKPKFRILL